MPSKPNTYNLISWLSGGMLFTAINIILMVIFDDTGSFQAGVYFSITFWIASIFLWIMGLTELRKKGLPNISGNYMSTSKVVSSGIYQYIKHPQYLAYVLFNLGIIFKIQTYFIFITGILAIAMLIIGMKKEEKDLIKKFGEPYLEYLKRRSFF